MKRIYIIFAMVLLSVLTISGKEKDNCTITVNSQEQTITIQPQTDSNIQNVKIIKGNEVVIETSKARGQVTQMEIPIESLTPGTYFIRIQTADSVEIQRIIIS
jgi:cell division protein YceG involved in septum cleavage